MLIEEGDWDARSSEVLREMQAHTKQFVTPISRTLNNDEGEMHGTGVYVQIGDHKYLITNEHVASAIQLNSITHQFLGSDLVFRALNPFLTFGWPIDAAIMRVPEDVRTMETQEGAAIPEHRLALFHAPVESELLFFQGFSGEGSHFLFGNLFSRLTSYVFREVPLPQDVRFKDRFHFGVDYRPDMAKIASGDSRGLPQPKGFSGSLVWNTRFVQRLQEGNEWSPDDAVVTGLVWGWPSALACLVATRIEYVRSFLLMAVCEYHDVLKQAAQLANNSAPGCGAT